MDKRRLARHKADGTWRAVRDRQNHRQLRQRGAVLDKPYAQTYAELFRRQRGRCAICREKPKKGKRFNLDHDHETGQVRGLLCWNCNRGLAFVDRYLARTLEYLG